MTAIQGVARNSLETDTRGPHGRFPRFKNKPENHFPHDKYIYIMKKNLGKLVMVENMIWSTFHYCNFFQIPTDFEIFKGF
jgi:hypothetical protein